MNIVALFLGGAALFALAYWLYGGFLSRRLGVDDHRPTPALTQTDGVDYVPTATPVVFGHHFSSIAGAGPIVGPIIAGMAFGWLPAILWIILGAIFFGGVHDFTAIFASLRNGGRTIGQICRNVLGRTTYTVLLTFILFTLIYVIIVFLDLTALSFAPAVELPKLAAAAEQAQKEAAAAVGGPEAEAKAAAAAAAVAALDAGRAELDRGGAVATASLAYIALAVLFGLATVRGRLPLWLATLVFVPLVFLALGLGQRLPLTADQMPVFLGSAKNFWALVLLIYCAVASVLPVWVLLQPRDYLSSFLLYACLAGGAVGVVFAGARGAAPLAYPAFLGWNSAKLGFLFPALFVTIACGAISGFHAMVASGTTARQARAESAARVVGYGGMLVEGVLALLALATVMVLAQPSAAQPVAIFADGLGRFLGALGLPSAIARTFGMLAVSTFLLTTLDTCTRLCRFVLQELFGIGSSLLGRIWTTLAVLALPAAMAFRQIAGKPAWQAIWPAFGASNQLMAALALLVVYVWLRSEGRAAGYVLAPTAFMFVTTVTALGRLAWINLYAEPDPEKRSALVGGISLGLAILAIYVFTAAVLSRWRARAAAPAPASAG